MKKRINITVEAEIAEKAHELGLNVSKIAENALKEAIKRLQTPVQQTETNGGYIDTRSVSRSAKKWTGRDLNPRPPECKSGVHARLNYRPTWNHEDTCQTKLFLLLYEESNRKRGLREYKGEEREKGKGEQF